MFCVPVRSALAPPSGTCRGFGQAEGGSGLPFLGGSDCPAPVLPGEDGHPIVTLPQGAGLNTRSDTEGAREAAKVGAPHILCHTAVLNYNLLITNKLHRLFIFLWSINDFSTLIYLL